ERLGARGTQRLTSQWRLTLEPERLKNRLTTAGKDPRGWNGFQRHSSCLWFQMLSVEADSFLPDDQNDRCNFACQRETRHLRADSLGNQGCVKLLERPRLGGSDDGCALENVFEIMIVIAVEPAQRYLLLGWLQLPIDIAVIGTAVRLDPQTAEGPQLSLGTEPVRRLQNRDQLGRADRPNRRNLTEQFPRLVFL